MDNRGKHWSIDDDQKLMETPHVPLLMDILAIRGDDDYTENGGLPSMPVLPDDAIYVTSNRTFINTGRGTMSSITERLFALLHRNAASLTAYEQAYGKLDPKKNIGNLFFAFLGLDDLRREKLLQHLRRLFAPGNVGVLDREVRHDLRRRRILGVICREARSGPIRDRQHRSRVTVWHIGHRGSFHRSPGQASSLAFWLSNSAALMTP